ncbi:Phosphatidylinositol (PI) 3-kinase [Phlyctochytrium bullatum]|nr:Phosphatidylinositol (PI) 3-kinase [Phlyctochytrium bullatum]
MRRYERGDLPHLEWLDQLVFREIEKINKLEHAQTRKLYLYVDLPHFDFPVVLTEKVILKYPPTKILTTEEKDLLWKYRFYLTRDKKALTKFLKCVVWADPVEERQAVELLTTWVDIDLEDALELLGMNFQNKNVRSFAVAQLKKSDDEVVLLKERIDLLKELQLYLLQLVQALRFEGIDEKSIIQDSPLASFLISRSIKNAASVFKSALMPLRLTFTCIDGSEYPIIFKTGDDMRQDQLVVQIITLMDKLLRKENLDLKLTPYKVLATGSDHDTYIKSCAGYCVITYLLGVGDRHLDNILLTTTGHLFHIDFGFILGRDPKPFPPPMKLSKEMVDVMGGTNSASYQKFKSFCFVAFNSLRKSANLILNLFALMVSANVPDIALEPDKAVLKVQEKFCLHLNEEEAIQHLQSVINESVGAMFPQVMERIHQVAQLLRS